MRGCTGLLEALGVARERLILENRSRNTFENAQFTKAINLRPNSPDAYVLRAEAIQRVDSPQDEAQVLNNAQRLLEELRQGAAFPSLASQFSQDSSARDGGTAGRAVPPSPWS